MRTNLVFSGLIIIGLISCSKADNSVSDNLSNKTWQLQTTGTKSETVVFSKDATYTITELDQNLNGLSVISGTVKGLWKYENGQITFTTAKVGLTNDNSTGPEVPVVSGQSIGSFYGIGSNLSNDPIINYIPASGLLKNYQQTSLRLNIIMRH
jgi:hypothetical protein